MESIHLKTKESKTKPTQCSKVNSTLVRASQLNSRESKCKTKPTKCSKANLTLVRASQLNSLVRTSQLNSRESSKKPRGKEKLKQVNWNWIKHDVTNTTYKCFVPINYCLIEDMHNSWLKCFTNPLERVSHMWHKRLWNNITKSCVCLQLQDVSIRGFSRDHQNNYRL